MIPILLALFIPGCSYAYTRFDTTCTVPTTPVNYVSSPDTRGTLDILLSCLFTVIACTWTIQHLNIPKQRNNLKEKRERLLARREFLKQEPKPNFFRRLWYDIKSGTKSFWDDLIWDAGDSFTSLKWMVFTILAPEFILGKAVGDFFHAWKLKMKVEDYAIEDNVEWSLSHGFFADMGGFRVIIQDEKQEERRQEDSAQQGADQQDGQILKTQVIEGLQERLSSLVVESLPTPKQQLPDTEKADIAEALPESSLAIDGQDIVNSYILSGEDIYKLRNMKIINRLPSITTAEIHDKSRSNVFVKALAIIQVFWVSLQVIVRSARGLAVSQLELVVTAFSLCAIITYMLLIPKPQGVQIPMRPIRLERRDWKYIDDSYQYSRYFPLRAFVIPSILAKYEDYKIKEPPHARIPNDVISAERWYVHVLGIALGGIVFGVIHIAGWWLIFPTSIERELWRISSILVTYLLPVSLLFMSTVYNITVDRVDNTLPFAFMGFVFGVVPGGIYVIARLFLLVETFRTLVHLPPDTFISTWVSNIPNMS